MPLDQGLVDSVGNENIKVGAGMPSAVLSLSLQNAVSHQNRMNVIAEAATGNIVRRMTELDPAEAAGILKTTQGDLGAQLGALIAAISSNQQASKTAGNTPPVTP